MSTSLIADPSPPSADFSNSSGLQVRGCPGANRREILLKRLLQSHKSGPSPHRHLNLLSPVHPLGLS